MQLAALGAVLHQRQRRATRGTLDNFKMVGAWTYNNDGLPNPSGATSIIERLHPCGRRRAEDLQQRFQGRELRDLAEQQRCAIQFGWFPKTVSNVTISDIDVIHFEHWYGVNQVNCAVINYANAGGPGTISGIHFNNFHVEGKVLRLFGLNTVGSKQVLKDFTFNNLSCSGMGAGQLGEPGANYFIGNITDWSFTNFVLGGTNITSPALATSVAQFEFSKGARGVCISHRGRVQEDAAGSGNYPKKEGVARQFPTTNSQHGKPSSHASCC